VRRPLLAAAVVVFVLGALYSLAAPWLAQRQLASATSALSRNDLAGAVADAKRAHSWDPLSTSVLLEWAAFEDATPLKAQDLYRRAITLEPQSSEAWFLLGDFYWAHGAWRPAYDAYSEAWKFDRFGPAGKPCGPLDQARHKVLHTWPPSCPRGRPRAVSP
jgi:tetratricopeptide (TPR) repeat protein